MWIGGRRDHARSDRDGRRVRDVRCRSTRWANIVAAIGLFLFNIVGLPAYPGLYDKALIVVGLVINALTIWTAWGWDGS